MLTNFVSYSRSLYKKQFKNLTLKQVLIPITFILLVFVLFFVNAFHESYPDEFDNILGGWYILQGKLPYTGFFTHHGPIPYFLSTFILLFSGQSFVKFRIIYSILLAIYMLLTYFFLRKRLGDTITDIYPFFILVLGLFASYYWSHMLLADNIAAFLLFPIYALIFWKIIYRKKINLLDIILISVFSALALYSSLTYTYLYIGIIGFSLFSYIRQFPFKLSNLLKHVAVSFSIVLVPHVLFFVYLLLTNSLNNYIYQNFVFNTKYYIYNYPRADGSEFINPIRFAIIIANNYINDLYILILGLKDFNLAFPLNMTMALSGISILIYTLFKKKYLLSLFVIYFLIFANARSSILNSSETDYQSAVYVFVSFFNLFFILKKFYKELYTLAINGQKVIYALLFATLSIYTFYSLFYLVRKFDEKFFNKYMGKAPLIYDRPSVAPVINLLVSKNDYSWIGPFAFEELFYLNAKVPSRYHILIRGVGQSDPLISSMVADFEKNKPKVLYFDREFSYLGSKASTYSGKFTAFLDKNYTNVTEYEKGEIRYDSIVAPTTSLDLRNNLYIRKDEADEIIAILIKNNYLRQKNKH